MNSIDTVAAEAPDRTPLDVGVLVSSEKEPSNPTDKESSCRVLGSHAAREPHTDRWQDMGIIVS